MIRSLPFQISPFALPRGQDGKSKLRSSQDFEMGFDETEDHTEVVMSLEVSIFWGSVGVLVLKIE